MKTRFKHIAVVLCVACAVSALALAGCSSSAASSSGASGSGSQPASSGASSSGDVVLDADQNVYIDLDYNAGTGYEWQYAMDAEGVLGLVSQTTEDAAEGQNLDGGPLTEHFRFRPVGQGEVVITFDLVRPWEDDGEVAETQVYAFTVSDEYGVVLNPYKSNFANEPVIDNDNS